MFIHNEFTGGNVVDSQLQVPGLVPELGLLGVSHVCMGFTWSPPTFQKNARQHIGYAKLLLGVNEYVTGCDGLASHLGCIVQHFPPSVTMKDSRSRKKLLLKMNRCFFHSSKKTLNISFFIFILLVSPSYPFKSTSE